MNRIFSPNNPRSFSSPAKDNSHANSEGGT